MPAILRIFVYQTDASPSVIGSTVSYGVIAGGGGPHLDSMETCEQYEVSTFLDIYYGCIGHSPTP